MCSQVPSADPRFRVFAHSTSDESVFAHSTNRVVSDPAARPPKDFDLANPYVDGRPSDGTGLAAMAHENHVIREKFIKIEMAKVRSQSPFSLSLPPWHPDILFFSATCHRGADAGRFERRKPAGAALHRSDDAREYGSGIDDGGALSPQLPTHLLPRIGDARFIADAIFICCFPAGSLGWHGRAIKHPAA